MLYDITIGEKKLLEHINSIVSHEMRNPLNAIEGQILALEHSIEILNQIIRESAHLNVPCLIE